MMNASWPIGSILGPIIGGIVQEWFGWRYTFYVASLISATTLLPAMMLKESNHARTNTKLGIGNLRPVIPFFVLNFLTGFGMGATSAIIPIYVQILFHTTPTELGLFFSIGSGVAMLLAQFPASWLPTKYGRRKTLLASQSVLPLMFLLWPFVGEYSVLLLIYVIINGFWSITWPSSLSLLMGSIEPERRGVVAGLAQTTLMLGFSIGPLLGGVLWERINPAAPFFASALILVLSLPAIYELRSLKTGTA
jgi:DHA1 family multidrug resistance protein-like MFS transporter